jgi:hypothetical protein
MALFRLASDDLVQEAHVLEAEAAPLAEAARRLLVKGEVVASLADDSLAWAVPALRTELLAPRLLEWLVVAEERGAPRLLRVKEVVARLWTTQRVEVQRLARVCPVVVAALAPKD